MYVYKCTLYIVPHHMEHCFHFCSTLHNMHCRSKHSMHFTSLQHSLHYRSMYMYIPNILATFLTFLTLQSEVFHALLLHSLQCILSPSYLSLHFSLTHTHTHTHTHPSQSTSSLYFLLGGNPKVRISVQTMFSLAHHHGNMLREGWKKLLDCLLTLFTAKLLPECMVEV